MMRKLSISFVLTSMILLLGLMTISLVVVVVVTKFSTKTTAGVVARCAVVDRDLFLSMTRMRSERSYGIAALQGEPDSTSQYREIAMNVRAALDESLKASITGLAAVSIPALVATGQRLDEKFEAWKRMRPAVDVATVQSAAARDKTLAKRSGALGLGILEDLMRSPAPSKPRCSGSIRAPVRC